MRFWQYLSTFLEFLGFFIKNLTESLDIQRLEWSLILVTLWLFVLIPIIYRTYSCSMLGEEFGVPPRGYWFHICYLWLLHHNCESNKISFQIFTLGSRRNTLSYFDCRYIQPRRWDILGTIKFHLSLNILLLGRWKEVQDVRLSLSHWGFPC